MDNIPNLIPILWSLKHMCAGNLTILTKVQEMVNLHMYKYQITIFTCSMKVFKRKSFIMKTLSSSGFL